VLRHRDKIVAQAGAGLFVHGGNPLYYTYKGTPEDVADEVQAVMRSSPEDLGGHHLVLKIARDDTFYTSSEDLPRGFTYHMWVEKAPLTAAGNNVLKSYTAADSIDPATRIFQSSLASTVPTSGILKGWLRNLASSMRLDEQLSRADKLHPAPPSAESPSSAATGAASPGKWSWDLVLDAGHVKLQPHRPAPRKDCQDIWKQCPLHDALHQGTSHPGVLVTVQRAG
jgi:hypothetical protein